MKTILFQEDGIRGATEDDLTLLDLALKCKVSISHSCGGMGSCGTCLLKIKAGLEKLPPRNEIESEMASDRSFQPEERLACQNPCINGLEVWVVNP